MGAAIAESRHRVRVAEQLRDVVGEVRCRKVNDESGDLEEETLACMVNFTHSALQIITPNGDYQNDYFTVEGDGVSDFYIGIYTQPGELVFESRDVHFRWGGTDRFGNAVPAGTYFYRIVARDANGVLYHDQNAKGSIQVFR